MIKKIPLAVLLLISLVACKTKSALNYNQEFVKKEKGLTLEIKATESKVKNFAANDQFDSIAVAGSKMENSIDIILKQIKDEPAPDVKEGENFKEAGIRYFAFIKTMYTSYKDFGNAKTEEARAVEMEKLRDIMAKKTKAAEDIQDAQRKYATANNFKIESN